MSAPDAAPHSEPTVRVGPPSRQPVADSMAETLAALDATITEARGQRRARGDGELATVAPGDALGRFTVAGELGRGGMGQVVRARDPLLGRALAIKVLGRDDPALERKFVAEAVITGLLEHPSIIPVYELGFGADGRPFLAMREVRGRTLADRLAELRARLDREGREALDHGELGALLRVFLKVCDAVELAHSRGVIHRDIKPANVMIGEFGEVYLLDWGLARVVRGENAGSFVRDVLADSAVAEHTTGATLDGSIVGTPQYMSPEQARGEVDALDERADVYALGVVLYELAALAPAFRGDTVIAVIEDVASGTWTPPSRRSGTRRVPWELEAVIVRAMAFEPAARFASVAELRGELERFLAGELLGSASYSPRRMLGRVWRRYRVAIVLAALAVASGAALVVYTMREIATERDQAREAERDADAARASAVLARGEAEGAARRAEDARALVERAARREQADSLALRAKEALDARALDEALLLASEARDRGDTLLARAVQLGLEPLSLELVERWRFASRPPHRAVGSADAAWIACIHPFHVEVWSLPDHRFAGRHETAGRRPVRDVAWLGAPPRLALVGDDGAVVVQRVGSPVGEPFELGRTRLPGMPEDRIVALAGTPDGQWLIAGCERGELWRAHLRNTKIAIRGHHGERVERLLAGPDGLWLSAGREKVRAWRDSDLLATLELTGSPTAVAISGDGRRFAVATGTRVVLGTDQAQGATATIAASRPLVAIACGKDERVLGGDDGARRSSWRADGTPTASVRAGGRSLWLGVDEAGHYVDLARSGRELWLSRWGPRPGRDGRRIACASPVAALAFAPDGGRLLVGEETALELFDLVTGGRASVLEGVEPRGVWLGERDVAWVATATGLRRGAVAGPLDRIGPEGHLDAIAVAPDGTMLALDRAPALRVLRPGAEPTSLELDRRGVTIAACQAWWIVSDEGGGVSMIDPTTRQVVIRLRADRALDALAISPSGRVVAGANADGLGLWDPRTPGEPRVLALAGQPTALAFLDDELLLTGDDRGVLSVWDVARGVELVAFAAHSAPVTAIARGEVGGSPPRRDTRPACGGSTDGSRSRRPARRRGWRWTASRRAPSRRRTGGARVCPMLCRRGGGERDSVTRAARSPSTSAYTRRTPGSGLAPPAPGR